jgi:Transposase DDE domain
LPSAIKDSNVRNVPLLKRLRSLFAPLHGHGAARDHAGNRTLHYDDYCILILLALFSPVELSLRRIIQISDVKKVKRKLGISRTSLGSFSESSHLFDPTHLEPIIAELAGQLPKVTSDPRLKDLRQVVTLVDGTLLRALPRISEAMWLSTRTGTVHHAFRLHTQFELDRHTPMRMDLTDGRNSGQSDEKSVLREHLQKDRCYVMDRWYAQFQLFNDINTVGSSYVCRVRDNSVCTIKQERALTIADEQAGVISDQIVDLGQKQHHRIMPDHTLRLVCVRISEHEKRSNRKGNTGAGPSDGILRIATNLIDAPAEIIALLYRYRYTIELFFRFFKQALGCNHLLSDHPNGIRIQTYCAVIASILIQLQTGRRADKATQFMIGLYLSGVAELEELLAHVGRPDNRGVKLRAKDELWKKLGV